MRRDSHSLLLKALLLASLLSMGGCGYIIERQSREMSNSITAAIMNNDDIRTVEAASPTFLILVDGLIQNSPDSAGLNRSGASMYAAYSSMFAEDEQQKKLLSTKAFNYALRGACLSNKSLCGLREVPLNEFQALLNGIENDNIETLYTLGSTWINWIQMHSSDWNAVAELARPTMLLERVLKLDEAHDYGSVHLYLGVIDSLLPAALGGKPESARAHFERCIVLSNGHNLMAKVVYAESYARAVFDQELHDRLLNEVLETEEKYDGLVLRNELAKQKARELLASGRDYF